METDWNERYQNEDTPWDKGAPAPGLVDWLKQNTLNSDSRVLVPGCGRGHDASEWAKAGFETTGIDLSNLALSDARQEYESLPGLAFLSGNFLEDEPNEPYDLIFEHTLYCAIEPARRAEYAEAVDKNLKAGGLFLAIHFLFPLSEEGPPFGASQQEILDQFNPYFKLLEQWKPNSFEGRENEERMFLWSKN